MDDQTLQSLETLQRCIALLNQRCDLLQEHIKLLSDKIAELLEAT